jgi:catechol 2,3-dioxygenase-like lactoylglutathione lyase family enzyme
LAPPADESFRIEFIAGPGCSTRQCYEQLIETHADGGWHHLCFSVDDVDETVSELKRRGVRIVSEPRDALALQLRFAFFSDPWGNLFEISQPLGAATLA